MDMVVHNCERHNNMKAETENVDTSRAYRYRLYQVLELYSQVQREAYFRLIKAYQNFFRRVKERKQGKKATREDVTKSSAIEGACAWNSRGSAT